MALINCPECGREVSDAAEKCPVCGYPLREPAKKENSLSWLIVLIAAVTFLGLTAVIITLATHDKTIEGTSITDNTQVVNRAEEKTGTFEEIIAKDLEDLSAQMYAEYDALAADLSKHKSLRKNLERVMSWSDSFLELITEYYDQIMDDSYEQYRRIAANGIKNYTEWEAVMEEIIGVLQDASEDSGVLVEDIFEDVAYLLEEVLEDVAENASEEEINDVMDMADYLTDGLPDELIEIAENTGEKIETFYRDAFDAFCEEMNG